MVCQGFRCFFLAITQGVFVAGLRDISEPVQSLSEDESVGSSKATEDLLHTVNDALRNRDGQRGTMLEKAAGILRGFRTQGKNASQYMTDEQRQMMDTVIELVNISIFGEMYAEHDTDVQQIANSTHPQRQCDANLENRGLAGGDIGAARAAHNQKKVAHVDCRNGEENPLQARHVGSLATAEAYRANWRGTAEHMLPSPTFTTKQEDELNSLFDRHTPGDSTALGQSYYNWFYQEKATWEPKWQNYTLSKQLHEDKIVECNNKQLAFESEHCMLFTTQVDACIQYHECYVAAEPFFHDTNSLVTANIERRKFAYQKGMVVMDLINCFLGRACENATAGNFADSHFNITFLDLPTKMDCAPDYDSLPCDEIFRNQWYVPYLPSNAPANGIQHCAECQGLQTIEVADHCINAPTDSDGDEMSRDCSYYSANPSQCRGQGPDSYAVQSCCACGGGYNGILTYSHYPKHCIWGYNAESWEGKSLSQCARECDSRENCHAFEFGVDYGEGGRWNPGRCQMQKTGKSNLIESECTDYNIDLYVKEKPAVGYTHIREKWVSGHNLEIFPHYTVQQCADKCNEMQDCKAFEFGTDYGSDKVRSISNLPGDCRPQDSTDDQHDGTDWNLDLYIPQ